MDLVRDMSNSLQDLNVIQAVIIGTIGIAFSWYFIVLVRAKKDETKEPYVASFQFQNKALRVLQFVDYVLDTYFGYQMLPVPVVELNELVEKAPVQTIPFGDQTSINAMHFTMHREFAASKEIGAFGRISLTESLRAQLKARAAFMTYYLEHHCNQQGEVVHQKNTLAPFIMAGLPRTGSTLLHHLLACDPESRTPFTYEMHSSSYCPVAPPAHCDEKKLKTHPWYVGCKKLYDDFGANVPSYKKSMNSSHYMNFDNLEEEMFIMLQELPTNFYGLFLSNEINELFFDKNQLKYLYVYLARYLEMLETSDTAAGQPPRRWALKTPMHSYALPELRNQFPNANIIITHRSMQSVVKSFLTLFMGVIQVYFKHRTISKARIGGFTLNFLKRMTTGLINDFKTTTIQKAGKSQQGQQQTQTGTTIHVKYDEWIKDPIEIIRKIYAFNNISVSKEFEAAMQKHLIANPKGKHGHYFVNMDEFGITEQIINETFKDYIQTFQL